MAINLQPKPEQVGVSHQFSVNNQTQYVTLKAEPNAQDYAMYRKIATAGYAHYFVNGSDFVAEIPTVAVIRLTTAKKQPNQSAGRKPLSVEAKAEADKMFLKRFSLFKRADFGLLSVVSNKDLINIARILGLGTETDRSKIWDCLQKHINV